MFRKPVTTYIIAVVVLLVLCLVFRNTFLHFAFKRVQTKAHNQYHLNLNSSSVYFSGLDWVCMENTSLQPDGKDTLAKFSKVELNLSMFDLLTGKIGFDEIKVSQAFISAYHSPQRDNLSFLRFTGDKKTTIHTTQEVNYSKLLSDLRSRLIRAFNTAFDVKEMYLRYEDSLNVEKIYIPEMRYNIRQLSGRLINETAKDTLLFAGNVSEKNISYMFSIEHSDNNINLPFLNRERELKCRFTSVKLTLKFEDNNISISTKAQNFHLNHWRLANDDVVFEKVEFSGKLKLSDDVIELDSSSTVTMKNLTANLFANYHLKPEPVFTLCIKMPETVSDTFFHALPQGMFNTFKGISCTGLLAYDLFFQINTKQPDSLVFTSSLQRKNFTIRHYGAENYARMNEPFMYDACDKDRLVRKIEISPANPNFTPLNRISDYLVKSVLQSEDPSFMLHRGFLPEAFRESIIKNYKEKRFARGGSTISMQLVKNVFLSRDKTISRKAEEALIVYLIENLRLVPKERMLEVYLNVIEWGPNVYGIGEASRFYFNKLPSQLSLQESIFLASIIPSPKHFKYQFDKEGNLKSHLSGYFRILTCRMAYKGWISSVDTSGLVPDVKLTGPASRMILPTDTIPAIEEEEEN